MELIERKAALDALAMAAWKHDGDDAYSAGMEDGARHQSNADHDAIAALPAADTTALGAVVKPLVWRVQSVDCQVADTPWGSAAVQNESHALAPNRWGWWMVGSGEDDSPSGYGADIESAKAAAQADYTARILAAIQPPTPAQVKAAVFAVPEVAALVEAAKAFDLLSRNETQCTTDEADAEIERLFSALRNALAALEARHDPE